MTSFYSSFSHYYQGQVAQSCVDMKHTQLTYHQYYSTRVCTLLEYKIKTSTIFYYNCRLLQTKIHLTVESNYQSLTIIQSYTALLYFHPEIFLVTVSIATSIVACCRLLQCHNISKRVQSMVCANNLTDTR